MEKVKVQFLGDGGKDFPNKMRFQRSPKRRVGDREETG